MPRRRRRSLLDDVEAGASGDALTTSGLVNDSRSDATYQSISFGNVETR